MDDIYYYLAFSHCLGIGPNRFDALMRQYSSVKDAYEANKEELNRDLKFGIGNTLADFKEKFDPVEKLEEIKRKEITVLTREDSRYPQSLKNLSDAPICLYVKGDIDHFDLNDPKTLFFSIVGTRKPTAYGEQITKKFASELAQSGMVIVSGLAIGVDAMAHKSTIESDGRTVAFLGCGVDIIYPPANKNLYQSILDSGGLIISEFPPGMTVLRGLFIARNRLISGLSRGVLVIEGLKDSGALVTAQYAALQGKDVFAPPVPLTSPLSQAPNILLKQGAKLVTSVDDILEEYQLKIMQNKQAFHDLPKDEKKIVEILVNQSQAMDELVNKLQKSVLQISLLLSILEIKGIIEKNSEGKYQMRI